MKTDQVNNNHRRVPETALVPISDAGVPTPIEDINLPVTHYLWILWRHVWKVAAFVVAAVLCTLFVSLRLTPIYESTATVDIDFRAPAGIIGPESTRSAFNDADQYLATQIRLIQSDSVLRPVAQKYKLLEREEESGSSTPEEIARKWDSPILLKRLKVSRPPNTYLLRIGYRSSDRELAADVSNAIAQSYLEHSFEIRYKAANGLSKFMEKQMEELRAKMERSSNALAQYEKELSIINPEQKTNILSARLLELNTELTKAQADRVTKEAAYTSMEDGSLDAALVSSQAPSLDKLLENQQSANKQLNVLATHYGPNHPQYVAAKAQVDELQKAVNDTVSSIGHRVEIEYQEASKRERMLATAFTDSKNEFDKMNARSFEYQALKREADTDKNLYEELLRKIHEATINSSFQNSMARVADLARPGERPVFPNIPLNVLLAFLFSSMLAVGAVVLADMLDDTVRDPEQVSRSLKTQVIGTLPVVKGWRRRLASVSSNAPGDELAPGHHVRTGDLGGFDEAIRTLRNSILLADFDRSMRSLLVTSASPREGKSTTASHLAASHAEQGKRTLLIDGDLRRPSVHKRFSVPGVVGLSNVLEHDLHWKEALVHVEETPNLEILPAGPPARRAADVIGRELAEIIEEASQEFDLVVLDGPPLLGFAEPLHMATSVDGVIVVTRAGETTRKALATTLGTLLRLRANVVGVVLNEVNRTIDGSYYYYNHYYKYYHSPDKKA